jgi:hypothetical protein
LLVPEEVLHAQPPRHPGCATIVARLRIAGVRLLACPDRLLDPSGPPRRVGEPLAILGTFERFEREEQVVRLGPRSPFHRVSRAIEVHDALGQPGLLRVERGAPEAGTA